MWLEISRLTAGPVAEFPTRRDHERRNHGRRNLSSCVFWVLVTTTVVCVVCGHCPWCVLECVVIVHGVCGHCGLQDFDLCIPCYQKEQHPHKMERIGLDLDDGGAGSASADGNGAASQNPAEARRLSIQRCIQSLVHACQCRDANCRLPSCQKMKRVMAHTRSCRRKTNGGCPVCKQLIALCCYHAKHCPETKCPVPFCVTIKQKLHQQQLQQRVAQAHMMQRRMAAMRGGVVHTIASTPQTLYQPTLDPASAVGGKPTITTASTMTAGNPGGMPPSVVLIPQRSSEQPAAVAPVRPPEGAPPVNIPQNLLALQPQQRLPNKTVVLPAGTAPNAVAGVSQSTASTVMLGTGDTLLRLSDTFNVSAPQIQTNVAMAQQMTVAGQPQRPQTSVSVPGNDSS